MNRLLGSTVPKSQYLESRAPTARIDYASLENSKKDLPAWTPAKEINVTASPNPNWKWGQGTSSKTAHQSHVEIDPFEPGRPMFYNYTFLVSSIAPRPIGFVSTVSADGKHNLAPSATSKSSTMILLSLSLDSLDAQTGPRILCAI